jgi:hypothetical protein
VFLDPIISVEYAYPCRQKPVHQITIKQYYDGKEYCVRLDKFEKGVVERLKRLKQLKTQIIKFMGDCG